MFSLRTVTSFTLVNCHLKCIQIIGLHNYLLVAYKRVPVIMKFGLKAVAIEIKKNKLLSGDLHLDPQCTSRRRLKHVSNLNLLCCESLFYLRYVECPRIRVRYYN